MKRNPLHLTIALVKDYDIIRVLIDNGADIGNRNTDCKTPLHTFFSKVVDQVLRCHGELLDLAARDSRGMTLLHYLAWSSKTPCETFKKYHKQSRFDIMTVDNEGRSVLHFASQRGNRRIIEYLFRASLDVDVNGKDRKGKTALHYAIENKRACDTIEVLISQGAKLQAKNHQGRSALHIAAKLNNLAAIKALMGAGMADELHVADFYGMTSVQIAPTNGATASFLADMSSNLSRGTLNTTMALNVSRATTRNDDEHDDFSSPVPTSLQMSHDICLVKPTDMQAISEKNSQVDSPEVFRRLHIHHGLILKTWHHILRKKELIGIFALMAFSWLMIHLLKLNK